ncbi:hypothetical protein [Candidatus Lokiarchaeum ossiferum]
MEPIVIFYIIASITLLLIMEGTAVKLLIRQKEVQLQSLKYLIVSISAFGLVGMASASQVYVLFALVEGIGTIFLLLFVIKTYYRSSLMLSKIFIGSIILLYVATFILGVFRLSDDGSELHIAFNILDSLGKITVSLFFAYSSHLSLLSLKEYAIESWLEKRYNIITLSAFIFSIQGIASGITYFLSTQVTAIFTVISIVCAVLFAVGNYYAWVFLCDKRYNKPTKELSEEELNTMMEEGN